ncbi:MAG: ABC transporter substrate-binding protein [Proteobacteria bacterium]|nr:MAG: ABC transporter substrate-binding protein [Pseudomonadota bacterium]PIE40043.1 MAG: ABC transporter substrate-binding protein [Gammaproteobacteria bacterium]
MFAESGSFCPGFRSVLPGFILLLAVGSGSVLAVGKDVARDWVIKEFSRSTLSYEEQMAEMEWFIRASKPYRGMTIRVVSERIVTHQYEASVLAKAFSEITGIHVVHELTGEDDLIRKLQAQMDTGENIYDAYVNDSDLIGTHYRSQKVVPLSTFMRTTAKAETLPTLDLDDFIGILFVTAPNGTIYQLPDQQFANLYWFRYDWFSRPELQSRFKSIYGYELGVPKNWSAYEDIAEFFTVHVKVIDGQQVWGHMDYAAEDPSLGWRVSDAWLSMAGVGDKGLPNGMPVDEWGIRVLGCQPVGASVERGGALNGPAANYAVNKFIEWVDRFAPPEARTMNFTEAGEVVGQGHIAQQIFWYTAFASALLKPGSAVMNSDGTPKWRVAPSPKGAYWEEGMKLGYQDTGSWTLLKSTPIDRQKAAWLYAQFVVSKTVSLTKTLVGLTPIRRSDIDSGEMTAQAPRLGGFVEFYRSPGRDVWTPTGANVPDYPRLSVLWWQSISKAVTGQLTTARAMDELAYAMDSELARIASRGDMICRPVQNELKPANYWYSQEGSPKPKRDERPKGETWSYEEALKEWK